MKSEEFKKARTKLGLSQEALAKEMGRTKSIVSQWESGQVPIPKYADIIIKNLVEKHLYNGMRYDD